MKQLLISLLCVLGTIAVAIPASAQQNGGGKITVSGQVIDGDGLPVVGAVVMTASNEATVTDADGNWNGKLKGIDDYYYAKRAATSAPLQKQKGVEA